MSDNQSNSQSAELAWVGEVLRFWFDETAPADWFKKSDLLDAQIRQRFLALHEQLASPGGDNAAAQPRQTLASVIVLDQFSRNLFRGSARAFAADPAALQLARAAIERGFDAGMTKHQRLFLYLPFEHSENAGDQALSLAMISALGDAELTRYAEAHKVIIDRFGRFPHRNAALGRVSSAEETAFLKQPMSSF